MRSARGRTRTTTGVFSGRTRAGSYPRRPRTRAGRADFGGGNWRFRSSCGYVVKFAWATGQPRLGFALANNCGSSHAPGRRRSKTHVFSGRTNGGSCRGRPRTRAGGPTSVADTPCGVLDDPHKFPKTPETPHGSPNHPHKIQKTPIFSARSHAHFGAGLERRVLTDRGASSSAARVDAHFTAHSHGAAHSHSHSHLHLHCAARRTRTRTRTARRTRTRTRTRTARRGAARGGAGRGGALALRVRLLTQKTATRSSDDAPTERRRTRRPPVLNARVHRVSTQSRSESRARFTRAHRRQRWGSVHGVQAVKTPRIPSTCAAP